MKGDAPVIEACNLAKQFGDVQAVARADFDVREGELFGFLGPNGAGKTTTINMLTGLARPDAGTIRIGGYNGVGVSGLGIFWEDSCACGAEGN